MNLSGKGRWILIAVAAALLVFALARWYRGSADVDGTRVTRYDRRGKVERIVPRDVRVRIEVLNTTDIRGLARQGTFFMRDLGFDVVGSGNSSERPDSTTVLVRSDLTEWGERAARALGGARVEIRPDSSRYLDLTILLASDWRPPPQSLHP